MDEKYNELETRALKGEPDGLRVLFRYAERLDREDKDSEAIVAYRDTAIAYRISASRNLARDEDSEKHANWLTVRNEIYRKWIEDNPDGMRDLPFTAPGITRGFILKVVVEELQREATFIQYFYYLQEVLTDMGESFFSPSGSIQRRVITLLAEVFGLARGYSYPDSIEVRVALDPLADEVAKRWQICSTSRLSWAR
jgi:hypothetical protein